ncbi:hypothetical protein [Nocardioides alcanivorans]|uniref:hypothetical protein n=1 Tax=Nocardioides alcanivorans TaxID=2897352 RepID=UPI001F444632|nr:hypothetical protein [Nocardioides alcanivorans]
MGDMNPWRRLRALGDWTLHWHDPLADARMGVTRYAARQISLRADLTWEQRRCTILHECLHAEHGPVLAGHYDRHENAVRRETARLMLPDVRAIGEAMAWARDNDEAAYELNVDAGVLRDRLRWLHPAERHYLTRRLEEI